MIRTIFVILIYVNINSNFPILCISKQYIYIYLDYKRGQNSRRSRSPLELNRVVMEFACIKTDGQLSNLRDQV